MNEARAVPRVSVIVPVHNERERIALCLDSILAQSVSFEYEIIVVDDASTDGTSAAVRAYSNRHPGRIRLLINETKRGNGRAFARALRECSADYFHVLDADDYWIDTGKLQRQVDFLDRHPVYTMVAHNTLCKNLPAGKETLVVAPGKYSRSTFDYHDILVGDVYFHTSSVLFRHLFRGRVPDFLEHELGGGDVVRVTIHCLEGPLFYMDRVDSVYVYSGSGIWSALDRKSQMRRQALLRRFWASIVPGRFKVFAWIGILRHLSWSHSVLEEMETGRRLYHAAMKEIYRALAFLGTTLFVPGKRVARIRRALARIIPSRAAPSGRSS